MEKPGFSGKPGFWQPYLNSTAFRTSRATRGYNGRTSIAQLVAGHVLCEKLAQGRYYLLYLFLAQARSLAHARDDFFPCGLVRRVEQDQECVKRLYIHFGHLAYPLQSRLLWHTTRTRQFLTSQILQWNTMNHSRKCDKSFKDMRSILQGNVTNPSRICDQSFKETQNNTAC
jgi:hypothetical protein